MCLRERETNIHDRINRISSVELCHVGHIMKRRLFICWWKVPAALWCLSGTNALLPVSFLASHLGPLSLSAAPPKKNEDVSVQDDQEKVESSTWMFRGHPIAYECRRSTKSTKETPVLLLNGFGMGAFHQRRLMNALSSQEEDEPWSRDIYSMDYLGQGDSWPIDCEDGNSKNEKGLRYCAETWLHQIVGFIEGSVVERSKVHLVGNSVGGHLAVFVAAIRPDLVESVVLLNATPVWGLNLPFWSGHLPAPPIPKLVGRYLFDRIRDEATIREFLATTYSNREAYDDTLVQDVRRCTDNNGGHAAFSSILWSPSLRFDNRGFYECLQKIDANVLLCFGSDDPWCKPAFGRRMLRALEQRNNGRRAAQTYVELSSVGHCPNHEAPRATAKVLLSWMNGETSFKQETVTEEWGDTVIQPKTVEEITASPFDKLSAMLL